MNAPRPYTRRGLCKDQRNPCAAEKLGDTSVVPDQGFRIDSRLGGQCALAGGDYEVQTRWECW